MENIEGLIKDVSNICKSYLTEEEQIYISKKWEKYEKKKVCKKWQLRMDGWIFRIKMGTRTRNKI